MFELRRTDFPANFRFGVATAAYQIEGRAYGGCGLSHWDSFAAAGGTFEGQDGAEACAHYLHWKQDLDLIQKAGFDAYRFSVAWPRIFPDGFGQLNQEGLDFYDRLIDGMQARGLEPHLTLYHWDLPLKLAKVGGWTNPDTCKRFADFASLVADRFGARLASLATFNEPWCVAWLSHFLGHHAPGFYSLEKAAKAMHYVLLAHGLGLEAVRAETTCPAGIVLNMEVAEPGGNGEAHARAADLQDALYNRWFADALFHGAYPEAALAHLEPHMPEGWQQHMDTIKAPLDWLGLNYYTRALVYNDETDCFPFSQLEAGPGLKTDMGWEIYPQGLADFLCRLSRDYTGDLPLYVTENGMANKDQLSEQGVNDQARIAFFDQHLKAAKAALDQGVPLKGYFAWSLLDNFEWAFGYDKRFGLIHVDYQTQARLPKASWHVFKRWLEAA